MGLLVCHKCDNPPCCNGNHYFKGTHKDNQQDAARKGRKNPSLVTRKKMSAALMGNKRAIGNKGFSGHTHPQATRNLLKQKALRRPPPSEDFKQHLRSIAGNRKGVVLSEETKEKCRQARLTYLKRKSEGKSK